MFKNLKLPLRILKDLKNYPTFYQEVWLACARIPRGSTMTYGELAKKMGRPKAARAVGNALAKNPFAPIVPCHRVVAANGKLGGYSARGGVRVKLKMLNREK